MSDGTPRTNNSPFDQSGHRRTLIRTIQRKSFATLATTSRLGRAHSAGIVYSVADGHLWVHTMESSRKAKNIAGNPSVGVCIVYRRLPMGPPFTIHFQAEGRLMALDAPEVRTLIDAGHLKSLTGHGALEMKGACFLRVKPGSKLHSFGPGIRTLDLIRDPLGSGARTVELGPEGLR